MTVKQRLIEFLKYKKIGQKKFAELIGVSSGYVNAIRVSIQPDTIHKISMQFPELNAGWLLTGEGEMLKPTKKEEVTELSHFKSYSDEFNTIPLLPISAQGGTLDDFVMSIAVDDCERIISPIKNIDFAMSVSGDSMSPEYPSGSQILIKKINERAFIDWGRVYVLDTCNGSVIKKIMPSPDESKIKCVSVNPEYPPFEVSLDDVYGVYRVMLCMASK